jgi:hypothetical protein
VGSALSDTMAEYDAQQDEESAAATPRDLDMTLLHESVGILLHSDPEVSDRNVRTQPASFQGARTFLAPCASPRP